MWPIPGNVTIRAPGTTRAMARPADVEAHMRWNRRWAAAEDRIEEVVVVGNWDLAGVQARPAAPGVHIDRRGCDRDCPEQPRRSDPRLEVVVLMARIADGVRIEQINSYKPERPVVHATV